MSKAPVADLKQVQITGKNLLLDQATISLALVYYQRFILSHPLAITVPPALRSATCLYVAAKARETVLPLSKLKNQQAIVVLEYYLLQALDYKVLIDTAYKPLAMFAKHIGLDTTTLQMCWYVINDFYLTRAVLDYSPHIIALASIHLVTDIDLTDINSNFTLVVECAGILLNHYRELAG